MNMKLKRDLRETTSLFGEFGSIKDYTDEDIPVEVISSISEIQHYHNKNLNINIIFSKYVPMNSFLCNLNCSKLCEEINSHDIQFSMSNGIPFIAFKAKNGSFKQKRIFYCIKRTISEFNYYQNGMDEYSRKLANIISDILSGNDRFKLNLQEFIKNKFARNYIIEFSNDTKPCYDLNLISRKSDFTIPNIPFNIKMELNGNVEMHFKNK